MVYKIKMRNFIPFLFLLLAIYMSINVPGEGVQSYTDVSADFLVTTIDLDTFEIAYRYDNTTPVTVNVPLTVSGELNDFEFQFKSSMTAHGTVASYVMIMMNKTLEYLVNETVTRCSVSFSWTNLGLVQPNITGVKLFSASVDTYEVHELYSQTYSPERQINSTTTFSDNFDWTLGTLSNLASSYSDEYLWFRLAFDSSSYAFASEIWSGSIKLQSSEVSKITTWIYSIVGSAGCLLGAYWLLPPRFQFLDQAKNRYGYNFDRTYWQRYRFPRWKKRFYRKRWN